MFDSIAHLSYTVNNYAAATDRGSDAVVGLVVERAANAAAGVLPITDVSAVHSLAWARFETTLAGCGLRHRLAYPDDPGGGGSVRGCRDRRLGRIRHTCATRY